MMVASDGVLRMQETRYGCCDDGVTIAEGPRDEGCPTISWLCRDSQFGCCPDGVTAAAGQSVAKRTILHHQAVVQGTAEQE